MAWIKNVIHRALHTAGYDIRQHARGPHISAAALRRNRQLHDCGTTVVLDIGANVGQYGQSLRSAGYQGRIVSFEPVDAAYASLVATAANSNWRCERLALGSKSGNATINIAANNAESSSLLPMRSEHLEAAPQAAYAATQQVDCERLDTFIERSGVLLPNDRIWLKADVQGYELEVLEGASALFDHGAIVAIEIELSLIPLYEGGPLIEDVIPWLRHRGFALVGVEDVFNDPRSGATLQLAGTFMRFPPITKA